MALILLPLRCRVKDNRHLLSPNVIDNVDELSFSLADVAEAHLYQSPLRVLGYLFEDIDVAFVSSLNNTFPHNQWSVTEIDGKPMGKPICAGLPLPTCQQWH